MSKRIGTKDQYFYGHGKLLLSGEYFVLDGALSLALPTTVGQSMNVRYRPSYDPCLIWKSFNREGKLWLEAKFEFWHFDLLPSSSPIPSEETLLLQKILRQARKQNAHFLRDEGEVVVETRLEFPLPWGLGASSTLIHNISQWAFVSPFELLFQTMGGSGFDVACAQSQGPILYKKGELGPKWTMVEFDPPFKDHLYFVHLGKKQSSREATQFYRKSGAERQLSQVIPQINRLTMQFLSATTLKEFEEAITLHENLVSQVLGIPRARDCYFPDFPGEVKSLGAWGGDFVLVTASGGGEKGDVQKYFREKGFDVFVPFKELIRYPSEKTIPLIPMKNLLDLDPFFAEDLEEA